MSVFETTTVTTTVPVVIERGPTSWGAFVPAVPGVFAVGSTRAEVETLIAEALALHLEVLHDEVAPAEIAAARAAVEAAAPS